MRDAGITMSSSVERTPLILSCLWLLPVCVGCSEHRISLQEFLAMEDAQRAQEAATQPAAAAAPQPSDEMIRQQIGRYKLGPGDTLAITHYGTGPEATGTPMQVRVDREGMVDLPVVGKLKVAGMDMVQADEAVRSALVPSVFRDVAVHVTLVEPESTRVLVYGAVQTPGMVLLRRTERNLLFAIVGAGGVSQSASGRVTLRRLGDAREEITLNLLDPRQLKEALSLPPLQDGDLVAVEAAVPNTIFVGGLVLGSRPQLYPPGTQVTILQALAAAGGLRTDVTPTEGTLIRRMADGKEVQVKLDLDRLYTGRDPNITLAAGDVLWVPDTMLTRVQDWVNRNMFIRAGASATYGLDYSMPGVDYLNNAAAQQSQGFNNANYQNTVDPFGFLLQNQSLNAINNRLP